MDPRGGGMLNAHSIIVFRGSMSNAGFRGVSIPFLEVQFIVAAT